MNLFSFPVKNGESERQYLSLVQVSDPDFTPKAIVGYLKNSAEGISRDNIVYNPEFLDLFHKCIVLYTLQSQAHLETAVLQDNGFVTIVDGREKDEVIGAFEVLEGRIQPLSYQPHPEYRLITEKGMFQLPAEAERYLLLAITLKN